MSSSGVIGPDSLGTGNPIPDRVANYKNVLAYKIWTVHLTEKIKTDLESAQHCALSDLQISTNFLSFWQRSTFKEILISKLPISEL